ncbi:MAG: hypothetical protein ACI9Y1_001362 [Lentisphaeria bacterium]|jgi:hypothetical protein
MMNREAALNTLRLTAQASHADIVAAYNRLARRYPLQQFPARHTGILEAKTALLSPESAFKEMLFAETIDLNWLNSYSINSEKGQDTTSIDEAHSKQCLETLFRPHLKKGCDLFPPSVGMETEFFQMLNELGPEGLQDFMEYFHQP